MFGTSNGVVLKALIWASEKANVSGCPSAPNQHIPTYSLTFDVRMAFLSDGSHVNASSASPSSTSSSSKADTLVTMDEKQLSTVIIAAQRQ